VRGPLFITQETLEVSQEKKKESKTLLYSNLGIKGDTCAKGVLPNGKSICLMHQRHKDQHTLTLG